MFPRLTVGMATFDDYDGVYFTIQAMRLNNDCSEVEFIIVDNNPGGLHTDILKKFVEKIHAKNNSGVRYVPMAEPVGTSAPRDRVFHEAKGDAVMVMDSHVLLRPNTLNKLIEFYEDNDTQNLYSGPLLMDNMNTLFTHFDDYWRGQMHGIWGAAWQCGCHRDMEDKGVESVRFTPHFNMDGQKQVRFYLLSSGFTPITYCGRCDRRFPEVTMQDYESVLLENGYHPIGHSDSEPPFEIPGQGLGLFTCRKDAWLGFNENFLGFGGEEMYIHEKFRQAGHSCICLPWLKWVHRFGRPEGTPFPNSIYGKVRNYVIGHQELGWPLDPIHEAFVANPNINYKEEDWQHVLENPIKHTTSVSVGSEKVATSHKLHGPGEEDVKSLDSLYQWALENPRDLDKHLPTLRLYAKQCKHVTEITKRRESSIGLMAGKPKKMVTYSVEKDQRVYDALSQLTENEYKLTFVSSDGVDEKDIEETDLLFIDSEHTGKRLRNELNKFGPKVRRFIIMHDTRTYGNKGEDGQPGLLHAARQWMDKNPEWFGQFHTEDQYGLTILGRVPKDRPKTPVHPILPSWGPGTELKKLLKEIGIEENPRCDCNAKARQMDAWGIDGCQERLDTIVKWMKDNYVRWGWKDRVTAAAKAVKTGLAFKLNPLDPFPSLIQAAIEEAKKKEKEFYAHA